MSESDDFRIPNLFAMLKQNNVTFMLCIERCTQHTNTWVEPLSNVQELRRTILFIIR
jgi:hypothetical protein